MSASTYFFSPSKRRNDSNVGGAFIFVTDRKRCTQRACRACLLGPLIGHFRQERHSAFPESRLLLHPMVYARSICLAYFVTLWLIYNYFSLIDYRDNSRTRNCLVFFWNIEIFLGRLEAVKLLLYIYMKASTQNFLWGGEVCLQVLIWSSF